VESKDLEREEQWETKLHIGVVHAVMLIFALNILKKTVLIVKFPWKKLLNPEDFKERVSNRNLNHQIFCWFSTLSWL